MTATAPTGLSPLATAPARLEGGWRVAGRVASVVVALVVVALLLASLPVELATPGTLCTAVHGCSSGRLTAQALATLQRYGISLQAYTLFTIVLSFVYALVWYVAGAIVLLRRPDDRLALVLAIQSFAQAATNAIGLLGHPHNAWYIPAFVISLVSQIALLYLFALFPSGRFAPRWLRWAAVVWAALEVVTALLGWKNASLVLFFGSVVLVIGCQVYRYRFVSDTVQRQQAKTVVFAFGVIIAINLLSVVPVLLDPDLGSNGSLYMAATNVVTLLALLLGPIALTVAVLRYRLFDIDVIINRTLVYGSLTAFLAGVYFGSVLLLQHLAVALAGQGADANPLILVLSTLLIAALFQPLRLRLQRTIDRRFYRAKYDAAKTVARFADTLRGEVNLTDLERHLVGVVEETMQPAHISLWLRSDVSARPRP